MVEGVSVWWEGSLCGGRDPCVKLGVISVIQLTLTSELQHDFRL